MGKERIFVTVKTYPNVSRKHIEVACTAGIKKDGSWIRLYPIPFRRLEKEQKYKKYQWIETDIKKNNQDRRPESYRPIGNICPKEKVDTSNNWQERRKIVLEKAKVHTDLDELIKQTHKNKISLAIFKPTEIINFIDEDVNPTTSEEKYLKALNKLR